MRMNGIEKFMSFTLTATFSSRYNRRFLSTYSYRLLSYPSSFYKCMKIKLALRTNLYYFTKVYLRRWLFSRIRVWNWLFQRIIRYLPTYNFYHMRLPYITYVIASSANRKIILIFYFSFIRSLRRWWCTGNIKFTKSLLILSFMRIWVLSINKTSAYV